MLSNCRRKLSPASDGESSAPGSGRTHRGRRCEVGRPSELML